MDRGDGGLVSRSASVTALVGAALLAVSEAVGGGAGCGGSASRQVAAIGAAALGAVLLSMVVARRAAPVLLAAAVSAHAALALSRPAEICLPCGIGLALEIVALAAGTLWMGRLHPAAFAVGALAGFFGLGALIEAGHREEVAEATAAGPLTLHVLLKPGCPRCAEYLESEHAQVAAALPPGSGVEFHEERMAGQFAPRSYPCLIVTEPGRNIAIARLDGVRGPERAVELIERIRGRTAAPGR